MRSMNWALARVCAAAALAAAMLFSGGCGARRPTVVVNKPAKDALNEWVTAVKAGLADAGQPAALTTPVGRNFAISYSEAAVLSRYVALRNHLLRGRAATKILFDIVDLGLTAAVPISNGTRGKTILGSLATGFKGSSLSIDRNVFNEQSTATILSAMDTCVLRQQRAIARKSALSADEYTIFNGYADLTRLYGCTTLAGALQEMSENQAFAAKQEQALLAPVSAERVSELREIQLAFIGSLDGDRKLALAFLEEMKVRGFSESSERKEFLAAYRALAAVLQQAGEVDRFAAAARKVKLLAARTP